MEKRRLLAFVRDFWSLNEDAAAAVPGLDVTVSRGRDKIVKYEASITVQLLQHEKWVEQYLSSQIEESERMFKSSGTVEYRFQVEGFEWILERVTGHMYHIGHSTHTLYFPEYSLVGGERLHVESMKEPNRLANADVGSKRARSGGEEKGGTGYEIDLAFRR